MPAPRTPRPPPAAAALHLPPGGALPWRWREGRLGGGPGAPPPPPARPAPELALSLAPLARHLARHRLRQPALLDALADALLRAAPQLHTKTAQKLILPFSRTNYRPANHAQLFPRLEALLGRKAADAPLATLNILMSLAQLRHFPLPVLRQVFSPAFLRKVTNGPCELIVRRYLSFLDVAVALEVREYDGPRLDPRYRVCIFEGALTADEANQKYSYKGLVAEALRQLVGEDGYRQNEVVPPGFSTDFLLQISQSGCVLPQPPLEAPAVPPLTLGTLRGSLPRQRYLGSPLTGRPLWPEGSPPPLDPQGCSRREEPYPGTAALSSPTPTGSYSVESPCSAAEAAPRFRSPFLGPEPLPKERPLLPVASPGAARDATEGKAEEIHRVVLSVNDKWHYCYNSAVLVGSRAMRDRHLHLLGYHLVQLPYMDLERVNSVEEAKQYLCRKLRRLQV